MSRDKELDRAAIAATAGDAEQPAEVRRFARGWLDHFPETAPKNVHARLNARAKRRRRNKAARASRRRSK